MSQFEHSYPLDMPSYPAPARSTFRPIRVVGGARSTFTLHENMQKHQGFAWMLEFDYQPFKSESICGEWRAFFMKLHGRWGTFMAGDPDYLAVLGELAGTLTINGAGQSGNRISASYSGGPGVPRLLLPGAYLQIGTSLHVCTNQVSSDSAGDCSIDIEPSLRTAPSNGSLINCTTPRGIFRLDEDHGWSSDEMRRYGISIKATEAVPAT